MMPLKSTWATNRWQRSFPADTIPYPDESFTFILSEHVLEHLIDPRSVLSEWMRCLCPSGKIILFLPDKDRIFDNRRPRTLLSELIESDNKQRETQRLLDEWMEQVIKCGLASHYSDLSPEEMVQTEAFTTMCGKRRIFRN